MYMQIENGWSYPCPTKTREVNETRDWLIFFVICKKVKCFLCCNKCLLCCNKCLLYCNKCLFCCNKCLLCCNECLLCCNECLLCYNKCLLCYNMRAGHPAAVVRGFHCKLLKDTTLNWGIEDKASSKHTSLNSNCSIKLIPTVKSACGQLLWYLYPLYVT